jgi:hypothetical protein
MDLARKVGSGMRQLQHDPSVMIRHPVALPPRRSQSESR